MSPLDIRVAVLGLMLGKNIPFIKSSSVIAASELMPADTVLQDNGSEFRENTRLICNIYELSIGYRY